MIETPIQPPSPANARDALSRKTNEDATGDADQSLASPRPAAVSFVTTEHFTLQGARASTIAESTGRAMMFLGVVSGGLIALGLISTASRVGTAFYAFGLVLLPTLAFIGLVTFERALHSGIEDTGYARRIALLRGYYLDQAPELAPHLSNLPPEAQLRAEGLEHGRWQRYRTVAGMVAVVTAVLAGSAAGLLVAVATDHSPAAALAAGAVVAAAALEAMLSYHRSTWERAALAPLIVEERGEAPAAMSYTFCRREPEGANATRDGLSG